MDFYVWAEVSFSFVCVHFRSFGEFLDIVLSLKLLSEWLCSCLISLQFDFVMFHTDALIFLFWKLRRGFSVVFGKIYIDFLFLDFME